MYDKGGSDMSILIGVWFAVAGGLAALAGLTGMRRVRRLRRNGVATWAATVQPPARAGEREDGSPRPALIQYTLPDGRVVERISPALARKAASRAEGARLVRPTGSG